MKLVLLFVVALALSAHGDDSSEEEREPYDCLKDKDCEATPRGPFSTIGQRVFCCKAGDTLSITVKGDHFSYSSVFSKLVKREAPTEPKEADDKNVVDDAKVDDKNVVADAKVDDKNVVADAKVDDKNVVADAQVDDKKVVADADAGDKSKVVDPDAKTETDSDVQRPESDDEAQVVCRCNEKDLQEKITDQVKDTFGNIRDGMKNAFERIF
ncbi:uncharacterized protein LOC101850428 isoform X1 [Aplysia californica]|uniref:Uncharacterized protein LOC101850428 isoform X1 n=1 Tax=Aplysia californica TaxID=6500 RepID=A0ABM0JZJ0_APLCA|nr:uncharacterized protein LOC101850428 isoform X1 [Aplysia californica]